jgi:glycosyltransferase involved in cell wall biosynthesis
MLVAIDAQISAKVAGGTETALLSLIKGLSELPTEEQFLLVGLKGHAEELRAYMGRNQALAIAPSTYSWYEPPMATMTPRWQQLRQASGPLNSWVDRIHKAYRLGNQPPGPRGRRAIEGSGPLRPFVERAYRLYQGTVLARRAEARHAQTDELLRRHGAAVVHFPYPLHFKPSIPFVYEPWGLPHLHNPSFFRPGEPEWMDRLFRSGCERASLVVTATRWIKRDIVKRYDISDQKVAVIPRRPALPERPTEERVRPVRERYALPDTFALFPAVTWPSKNHLGLLHAIAALRARGVLLQVVCTGRTDYIHWKTVSEEMRRLGLEGQIRFLGPIPSADLHAVFAAATFLVFPSLYEGLGLPILEAFHFGLPVVASNHACIPEVTGNAALLFDPSNIESFADALQKALSQPSLLDELRQNGKAHLNAQFPDHRGTAARFVAAYRHAAGVALDDSQRALLHQMLAA